MIHNTKKARFTAKYWRKVGQTTPEELDDIFVHPSRLRRDLPGSRRLRRHQAVVLETEHGRLVGFVRGQKAGKKGPDGKETGGMNLPVLGLGLHYDQRLELGIDDDDDEVAVDVRPARYWDLVWHGFYHRVWSHRLAVQMGALGLLVGTVFGLAGTLLGVLSLIL